MLGTGGGGVSSSIQVLLVSTPSCFKTAAADARCQSSLEKKLITSRAGWPRVPIGRDFLGSELQRGCALPQVQPGRD